jgi:hypothetical protein
MNKTLFEQSFGEWCVETNNLHTSPEAQKEWTRLCTTEWARIYSSLVTAGHWHEGKSCAEARCKTPPGQPDAISPSVPA